MVISELLHNRGRVSEMSAYAYMYAETADTYRHVGHVTRKTVSEMTYNVSSGTLNTTIPYHTYRHVVSMDVVHPGCIKTEGDTEGCRPVVYECTNTKEYGRCPPEALSVLGYTACSKTWYEVDTLDTVTCTMLCLSLLHLPHTSFLVSLFATVLRSLLPYHCSSSGMVAAVVMKLS